MAESAEFSGNAVPEMCSAKKRTFGNFFSHPAFGVAVFLLFFAVTAAVIAGITIKKRYENAGIIGDGDFDFIIAETEKNSAGPVNTGEIAPTDSLPTNDAQVTDFQVTYNPTDYQEPTATVDSTLGPISTHIPEPTPTKTPTSTPEPTSTKTPTSTPEPTSTKAPTSTPNPTPTNDPTATPEPTPTATPVPDFTSDPTSTSEISSTPIPEDDPSSAIYIGEHSTAIIIDQEYTRHGPEFIIGYYIYTGNGMEYRQYGPDVAEMYVDSSVKAFKMNGSIFSPIVAERDFYIYKNDGFEIQYIDVWAVKNEPDIGTIGVGERIAAGLSEEEFINFVSSGSMEFRIDPESGKPFPCYAAIYTKKICRYIEATGEYEILYKCSMTSFVTEDS